MIEVYTPYGETEAQIGCYRPKVIQAEVSEPGFSVTKFTLFLQVLCQAKLSD